MFVVLYHYLTILLHPFMPLYLRKRQRRGKEHPVRMAERMGFASAARPSGQLIWVHAASVGEANAVIPLVEAILAAYPDRHVLFSTGTVNSAECVAKKSLERVIHQFIPVDTVITVNRFLRHWQPDHAIWTESELWPNLLSSAYKQGCKLILVNGRMSMKSFRNWQHFPGSVQKILSGFSLICAGSDLDASHFAALGAGRVIMPGNLKQDAPTLPINHKELETLVGQINQRPLWLAASTHDDEEKQIALVHKRLRATHQNLLTIIAPRHPARAEQIARTLQDMNLTTALRSKGEPITSKTDLYIADTMGELGTFYSLAKIVLVGGSLIPHGGQNPLEPARLHCALLAGIYTHNFTQIYDALEQQNAVIRVADGDALAYHIEHLLRDNKDCETRANHAYSYIVSQQGTLARIMETLEPFLRAEP